MDNKNKLRISKRAKLYIAVGVFLIVWVAFAVLWSSFTFTLPIIVYILGFLGFVFFSLIVYYLSIIADAVIEGRQGESFGAAREAAPAEASAEAAPEEEKAEEEVTSETAVEEVALTPEEALEKAIAEKEREEE